MFCHEPIVQLMHGEFCQVEVTSLPCEPGVGDLGEDVEVVGGLEEGHLRTNPGIPHQNSPPSNHAHKYKPNLHTPRDVNYEFRHA